MSERDDNPTAEGSAAVQGAAVPSDGSPAGTHDALADRNAGAPVSIALFAERRAQMGLTHEDVANQLKFAPRFLEALEAGEFDKLPGRTFARGMLRSYAKLLKIDPGPFPAQLGPGPAQGARAEAAVSMREPVPFSEGSRHNLMYTALSAAVLAAAAYFAADWYFDKDSPAQMAFVSPGREAVPVAPATQPGAPVAAVPAPVATETKPTTVASVGPTPVPETTPRPDAASAEPKPPLAPGKGRIVMKFSKDSWVEVKGANGKTLLSQLNPAGSEKTIEGDPPFQLTIGNAPNVNVTYNDQPVDLKPHFKVDVARLTLN